jgi:hypothetical protein
MPLAEAVPSIHDKRSQPRQRRQEVLADRGYDHDRYHRQAWAKGIKPAIARRGTEHGLGLGARRWVVAQAIALRRGFRRPRIRREIHDDIHEALDAAQLRADLLAPPDISSASPLIDTR